jgi:hypothetical protein
MLALRFCLYFLLILYVSLKPSIAMNIGDIKPHIPTKTPWSEQWFYYLNDPGVGYYKISFQTYISGNSPAFKQAAYIHLAFAPKQGKVQTYDLFYDDVILTSNNDPASEAFEYIIPEVIHVNEDRMNILLPEFNFSMHWTGDHKRYWNKVFNPGEGPFGLISSLPFIDNRWFVYSMGTPAAYSFSNGDVSHQGEGIVSIDKGWYTTTNAENFIYLFAADHEHQFMFTGARVKRASLELWAGRYLSDTQDLVFYPAINGLSVSHKVDPCQGIFHFEIKKLLHKIVIDAEAPVHSFYDSTMPTVDLLGAEYPVMKSMNATMKLKIYKFGELIEEKEIEQGFLEFGDSYHCLNMQ